MRYTRVIIAFVLTASLIFLFSFTVFADEVKDLYVQDAWLYYQPDTDSQEAIYSNVFPTDNGDGTFTFKLTEHINDNGNQTNLRSIAVLMYPDDDSSLEFEYGYIYTYNFTLTMTHVDDPEMYFEFGLCDGYFNIAIPYSDVTYTYSKISGYNKYQYNCTAILYIDETFNLLALNDVTDVLCCFLDITGSWLGNLTLINTQQTVTKAIGEDAYYQASLDAIQNLPESEYGFIYNSMPDSEGEIDVIQGEILDVLSAFDTDIQQLVTVLQSDQARPVVYLPEVHIPFLDVHVWDNHFFYVDDYLNSMNTQIMVYINYLVVFIRLVAFVGFTTVGIYRMSRIEWWY